MSRHNIATASTQGALLRPGMLSLLQLFLTSILHVGKAHAFPILRTFSTHDHRNGARDEGDPDAWVYLITAIVLVLVGGAFAGLTIALMGQDEVYLQVIATSGEGSEKKNAAKVLKLLKRGKHWVLVTLLVGNVITNETLPIVLDRSIGGGYAAAITSTLLVIVFGEIVPQSICVRFGLPIGAWMANFVLILMWIFAPISWPTAKLLDHLLGEDHGTIYKKAGLKTLVTLHKTLGTAPGDRLNEDEVSIISGVLDLKEKSVGRIMTPMNDVFTLPANAVLDEQMMDDIVREGYSRIPIYEPKNRGDFVGMLLVKMLITYDPEDGRKVSDFSLATLPETRPETSCLDIINFFQQGKSHMVLVSDFPGKPYGALGVVTLEDVIEELIGEEIIDESDVFIDVHKAIRRLAPAPTHRAKIARSEHFSEHHDSIRGDDETSIVESDDARDTSVRSRSKRPSVASEYGRSPKVAHLLMRRRSSHGMNDSVKTIDLKQNSAEMRQSLKSLGPSNAASRPRASKVGTVTIKAPGVPHSSETLVAKMDAGEDVRPHSTGNITEPPATDAQGGIGHDLVTAGLDARDGVHALQAGHNSYGTLSSSKILPQAIPNAQNDSDAAWTDQYITEEALNHPDGQSIVGSMHSGKSGHEQKKMFNKGSVRSGSLTEQFVESGGVRKMVLEATSSSEENGGDTAEASRPNTADEDGNALPKPGEVVVTRPQKEGSGSEGHGKRKKRRNKHRAKDATKGSGETDERAPLLS